MNTLKNCSECGNVFSPTITDEVCIECHKIREGEFDVVYKFLRQNPGSHIQEVSSSTGISVQKITQFIKNGRISLSTISGVEEKFLCKGCGVEIKHSAKLCEKCAEDFRSKLQMSKKTPLTLPSDKKITGKVHILERLKKGRENKL